MIYGRVFRPTFLYFRDHFGNHPQCPQRSHPVVSGTKSPPNLPLFPPLARNGYWSRNLSSHRPVNVPCVVLGQTRAFERRVCGLRPFSISDMGSCNFLNLHQRSHHVLSGTKSPPNLPLFPHGPSETCRSLAEKESDEARLLERDLGEAREGCGDYSWRNGKLAKWRKLVATKSGAKGGGDYSRRKPGGSLRRLAETTPGGSLGKLAEGCGGLWRLLPEEARGSQRRLVGDYSRGEPRGPK